VEEVVVVDVEHANDDFDTSYILLPLGCFSLLFFYRVQLALLDALANWVIFIAS
jgi:hypothetical protein